MISEEKNALYKEWAVVWGCGLGFPQYNFCKIAGYYFLMGQK